MQSTRCLFSTAPALRRVFLPPTPKIAPISSASATTIISRRPLLPQLSSSPCTPSAQPRPRLFSTGPARLRLMGKKSKSSGPAKGPPTDHRIPFKTVRVIDQAGDLGEPEPLDEVLERLERKTEILVLLAKPRKAKARKEDDEAAEEGYDRDEDEGGFSAAVCRIQDREAYVEAQEEAVRAFRLAKKNRKELELNWAIASNDLQHKLKQLRQFLEKGKRVEVMLAAKRGGRKAGADEAAALVKTLEGAAREVGGTAVKKNGEFPMVMHMHFEVVKAATAKKASTTDESGSSEAESKEAELSEAERQ